MPPRRLRRDTDPAVPRCRTAGLPPRSRALPAPLPKSVRGRCYSLSLLLQDFFEDRSLLGRQPPFFHEPNQQQLARAVKNALDQISQQAPGNIFVGSLG